MVDEALNEKEFWVGDAKRKLAWLNEEHQELQRSPAVRDYLHLSAQGLRNLTPQQRARLDEVAKLQDPVQHFNNLGSMARAQAELQAAEKDLQEYKRANNIALQASNPTPIQKKPPENAATNTSNGKSRLFLLRRGASRKFRRYS